MSLLRTGLPLAALAGLFVAVGFLGADRGGGAISGRPPWLARALRRLASMAAPGPWGRPGAARGPWG